MRYVFALGGNAFSEKNLEIVAREISLLHSKGNEVVVTHGNGPQVGELYLEEGKNLGILTGQTQAELGMEIERAVLRSIKGGGRKVAIVLTRALVSKDDPEFKNPTKPIGHFYRRREMVPGKRGEFRVKKLLNGYRLVVPSPKPLELMEVREVMDLLGRRYIVIAAGGGGVAVIRTEVGVQFANAVVDKDLASALLAERIRADRLFILTNVDGAYLNFGKKNEVRIDRIKFRKLLSYLRAGQFESGSMAPKVQACINFVKNTGKIAAIGDISRIEDVLKLRTTVILP